ncbi:FixH family protein [Catenulispora sp. NL8]|uniref:FixH family protein n=1 Tax=Catenulispora pinistramenti TaxID=2705254 RepID=A0ABS5KKJ0_9ACTN|nr:copper resistance protein CopC [Catenulispora pinistramenti]MBS2546454.1 FixH family protein [Catenulispora pinistramenti]
MRGGLSATGGAVRGSGGGPGSGRAARKGGGIRNARRHLIAVLTAVLCLWGLAAAPAASAHATVVSTDPADGTLLPTAPTRVTVTYDEAVSLQLGALRVFAPDGSQVEAGSADHLGGKPQTASVALKPGLKNGTYVASWRVISADSHPVRGAWTFSIGTTSTPNSGGAEAAPTGSRTVGVVYGVARWLAYLGFAALAGGALLLIAFTPKLAHDRRLRTLIGGGWFALLLGTVAALLLQGPYGGGFGIGRAFDTDVLRATLQTRLGKALAWRLMLLGAAGVMVSWIATRLADVSVRTRRVAGGIGAAIAIGLAATWSVADHSGTGSQVALALPADMLHLLAMATWVGGLAALAASVLGPRGQEPAQEEEQEPAQDQEQPAQAQAVDITDAERLTLVRRFSTTAFAAVCVLAATGIYQGWREVRHWDELFDTDYGRMLIIKSGIFLVLLTLGFLARRILAAASPDLARLRRSVAAEFGLAIVVLAVTALLVESQPASEGAPKAGPARASAPFDTGSANGTGTVNVTLQPARVGQGQLTVDVLDKNGTPESVPEVDAALALPTQQLGPIPLKLRSAGPGQPGRYTAASAVVPMAGTWQVLVTVRTTDIDQSTVVLTVNVRK